MLPSSMRRVVSTASATPVLSSLAPGSRPAAAAASFSISCRPRHQRRYSSSKPSSPDNGAKDLPAGGSVPASSQSAKSSGETKSGEKRKSKSKEAAEKHKLPSVPSTQHLPQESLALSAFFSLHRPISITHSLPKVISDDAFASIFLPRTRGQKTSDVISTLSRTVDDLEKPMATLSLGSQDADTHDGMHKIDLRHPDGSESSVYVQLNAMAGQFLPFSPPPAPGLALETAEAAEAADVGEEAPQHRVYKAVFTIEESTDTDGQVKIVAHSPQIIEEQEAPRSFLERMAYRQMRYEDARQRRQQQREGDMFAISVRRQRKLRMKKKKYKKLMKRTRNLRRKLDRT